MVSEDYRRISSWRKTDTDYQGGSMTHLMPAAATLNHEQNGWGYPYHLVRVWILWPCWFYQQLQKLMVVSIPHWLATLTQQECYLTAGHIQLKIMVSQLKKEVRVPHTLFAFIGGYILKEVIAIVLTPHCLLLHCLCEHPRWQRSSCRATSCLVKASHMTVMEGGSVIFDRATRCMF